MHFFWLLLLFLWPISEFFSFHPNLVNYDFNDYSPICDPIKMLTKKKASDDMVMEEKEQIKLIKGGETREI